MSKRKQVSLGLALGGGGARGGAHVGVLRVLEREGIPIGPVAGTSAGGFVALLYAAGKSPDEIMEAMARLHTGLLKLSSLGGDHAAVFSLERVRPLLEEPIRGLTFADLQRPCAVVAVDINYGEEVIIKEGLLIDALLATTAVPGLFPPVRTLGRVLVDGGILNPVPVNAARALGAEKVVAVCVSSARAEPYAEAGGLASMHLFGGHSLMELLPWREALQIYSKANTVTTVELADRRLLLDGPDVIIRPMVGKVPLLDSQALPGSEAAGVAATISVLPQIKELLKPPKRKFLW